MSQTVEMCAIVSDVGFSAHIATVAEVSKRGRGPSAHHRQRREMWISDTLIIGITLVVLAMRIARTRRNFRAGTLSRALAILAVRQRAGLPIVFGAASIILALPVVPSSAMIAWLLLRGNVAIETTGIDRIVGFTEGAIGILIGAGFYAFAGRLFADSRGPDAPSGQRVRHD